MRAFTRRFTSVKPAPAAKESLIIFDTTLRDGEQSPGATLNMKEKLEIATLLSRMGVDVCEAGFPIASEGDFEAVKQIALQVGPLKEGRELPMRIAGLSRASEKDISRCYDAVKHAPLHRIHTFLATSDIHLQHKLKITRDECVEKAYKAVKYAASLVEDVEFSTEDGSRSDRDFLVQVCGEVIRAGAKTINVPDTVGYTTPQEYESLIRYLRTKTPGGDRVIWSTHCHNDLGLATANTLAGVMGGARQVEVTVNGIGERAGNTSLEEFVMCVKTRPLLFPVHVDRFQTTLLTRASKLVSTNTGMLVQPNKAIVGANAFAHEAGIHTDGVLKHAETYEIMRPESVGLLTNNLVLGKHSGKSAFKKRLADLGFDSLTSTQVEQALNRIKQLAEEKKDITDADIEAVVLDEMDEIPSSTMMASTPKWKLGAIHVTTGNMVKSTATVSLSDSDSGQVTTKAAMGSGPVDAAFKAIEEIVAIPNRLTSFNIHSITKGIDAQGEVTTQLERVGDETEQGLNPQTGGVRSRIFTGHAADVDIVVASARSYLSALNKIIEFNKIKALKRAHSK
ncbi:2-isopropylmalate synthase [Batrachochytrium salamandrivorans]|nr:2-isopropylmalate synthase [Batrachochytrium salamandrivorans]